MSVAAPLLAPTLPLLRAYSPPPDAYDELREHDGSLRPHWRQLLPALDALGAEGLQQRAADASALLQHHGLQAGPRGQRWRLDAVPLVLPSDQWRLIERGLQQRAELLEALLRDLYGEQRLLHRGQLPPDAVFAHGGFLHASVGLRPPADRWLVHYAADLVRTPDGRVLVARDRADAPDGMGAALAARVALSRQLPSLFRDCHPHRLRLFFQTLRETLARLANDPPDAAVAVLTGGPRDPAHAEQAYLAQYLGYLLADSGELAVRDGQLWLGGVEPPQPVHAVLRTLASAQVDPLELDRRSHHGAPGLLQLLRRGSLVAANPPGVRVVENPALHAYLPSLCRTLLGQDLLLPSVPAWWCGDPQARRHVLDHLEQLRLQSLDERLRQPAMGAAQDARGRRRLRARIEAQPHLFVGRAAYPVAHAPVATRAGLAARPISLRCFAVADADGHYVMPGGLAASQRPDSAPTGGGRIHKDVWVLASEPQPQDPLAAVLRRPLPFAPPAAGISRRLADNLCWLGRYLVRLETMCRVFDEAFTHRAAPGAAFRSVDQTLLALLTGNAATRSTESGPEVLLMQLQRSDPQGLPATLAALVRAAQAVPEVLHGGLAELLGGLPTTFEINAGADVLQRQIRALRLQLAAARALLLDGLPVGQTRAYFEVGLRLEQALQSLRLLAQAPAAHVEAESDVATALLNVAGVNARLYTSGHELVQTRHGVVQLLLLEPTHPQSLRHLLLHLDHDLDDLAGRNGPSLTLPRARRQLVRVRERVEAIASRRLDDAGLTALCEQLTQQLRMIADLVARDIRPRANRVRQLSELRR